MRIRATPSYTVMLCAFVTLRAHALERLPTCGFRVLGVLFVVRLVEDLEPALHFAAHPHVQVGLGRLHVVVQVVPEVRQHRDGFLELSALQWSLKTVGRAQWQETEGVTSAITKGDSNNQKGQ